MFAKGRFDVIGRATTSWPLFSLLHRLRPDHISTPSLQPQRPPLRLIHTALCPRLPPVGNHKMMAIMRPFAVPRAASPAAEVYKTLWARPLNFIPLLSNPLLHTQAVWSLVLPLQYLLTSSFTTFHLNVSLFLWRCLGILTDIDLPRTSHSFNHHEVLRHPRSRSRLLIPPHGRHSPPQGRLRSQPRLPALVVRHRRGGRLITCI